MITENYVSFDTAKLLKEKGFNSSVPSFYEEDGSPCVELYASKELDWNSKTEFYSRPTLQMAMKWLREKYNIHIEPRYFPTPNIYRYVIIHSPVVIENIDSHPQYFNSYEEACEAAIKDCLENLI